MKEALKKEPITIADLNLLAEKVYEAMKAADQAVLADFRGRDEEVEDKARKAVEKAYAKAMDDYLDALADAIKEEEPGSERVRLLKIHRAVFLSKTVGFENRYGKFIGFGFAWIEDWLHRRTEKQIQYFHNTILVGSILSGILFKYGLRSFNFVGAISITLATYLISLAWKKFLSQAVKNKAKTQFTRFFTNQNNIDKHQKQLDEALDEYDDDKRVESKLRILKAINKRNRSLVGQKLRISASSLVLSLLTGGLIVGNADSLGLHGFFTKESVS